MYKALFNQVKKIIIEKLEKQDENLYDEVVSVDEYPLTK